MIDFTGTNLHIVTVTGVNRAAQLLATLSSVMANVSGLTWHIHYDVPKALASNIGVIKALADATGNTIHLTFDPPSDRQSVKSVAARKAKLIRPLPPDTKILNLDDDHVVPYVTLEIIRRMVRKLEPGKNFDKSVVTCAAVDVANVHEYEDWSNQIRPVDTLIPFVRQYGSHSAAHQKWGPFQQTFKGQEAKTVMLLRTDYISNGWIVPRHMFDLPAEDGRTILDTMDLWEPGVRGYDCMMQHFFVKAGITLYLMVGAYIEHIGMTTSGWHPEDNSHSVYYKQQLENRVTGYEIRAGDVVYTF